MSWQRKAKDGSPPLLHDLTSVKLKKAHAGLVQSGGLPLLGVDLGDGSLAFQVDRFEAHGTSLVENYRLRQIKDPRRVSFTLYRVRLQIDHSNR